MKENRFPYFVAPVSIFRHPVSPLARFVYLALAARAGRSDEGWLSYATIAEDTSLSRRSVHRALEELKTQELLAIHATRNFNGGEFVCTLYPPEERSVAGGIGEVYVVPEQFEAETTDDSLAESTLVEMTGEEDAEAESTPVEELTCEEDAGAESTPVEELTCEEDAGAESAPVEELTDEEDAEAELTLVEEATCEETKVGEAHDTCPTGDDSSPQGTEDDITREEQLSPSEAPSQNDADEALSKQAEEDPCVQAYHEAFGKLPPRSLVEDWVTLPPDYILAQIEYCSRVVARGSSIRNVPAFVRVALEHDHAEHSPPSSPAASSKKQEGLGRVPEEGKTAAKRLELIRETLKPAKRKETKRKRRDPWGLFKEPK